MEGAPFWQRLPAALAYLLPWSDALSFGSSLFGLFPVLQYLALPAFPLILLERILPFGNFIVFLVLFFAVARNPRVPYLVRFHVLQALMIDILLVVLTLAFQILLSPLSGGFMLRTLSNTVFLGTLLLLLFALVQSLRGQDTEIPTLSQAVRMQLQ
jgi:hypothetical protein